jgi:hypothetical protein
LQQSALGYAYFKEEGIGTDSFAVFQELEEEFRSERK